MQTKLRSDAFLQQAMDTCGDAVYRLALCRLNSRADAEDVYQEVFLRLLRDDTDFRDTEHLKAAASAAGGTRTAGRSANRGVAALCGGLPHRGDRGNGRLPSGNGTHAAASRKKAIKAGFGGILR